MEPRFHRYSVRLDWAARLILSYARGLKKSKRDMLDQILNRDLAQAYVRCKKPGGDHAP